MKQIIDQMNAYGARTQQRHEVRLILVVTRWDDAVDGGVWGARFDFDPDNILSNYGALATVTTGNYTSYVVRDGALSPHA